MRRRFSALTPSSLGWRATPNDVKSNRYLLRRFLAFGHEIACEPRREDTSGKLISITKFYAFPVWNVKLKSAWNVIARSRRQSRALEWHWIELAKNFRRWNEKANREMGVRSETTKIDEIRKADGRKTEIKIKTNWLKCVSRRRRWWGSANISVRSL